MSSLGKVDTSRRCFLLLECRLNLISVDILHCLLGIYMYMVCAKCRQC